MSAFSTTTETKNQTLPARRRLARFRRALRGPAGFILLLLAVEFLDELAFGVGEAAWPLIRDDLGLTYLQIGLLQGVPGVVASLVEPILGILGDTWKRWVLIVGGGLCFALAMTLTGLAPSFIVLLAATVIFYPASGAFVSLSQATLMDQDPARHEHLMARWTLAGSIGVVGGPFLLGLGLAIGLGWRGVFFVLAALALGLVVIVWRRLRRPVTPAHHTPPRMPVEASGDHLAPTPPAPPLQGGEGGRGGEGDWPALRLGFRAAFAALRRREVLRWLLLLDLADFMLDVLLGLLALYFVDVVGVTPFWAGVAVAVWSAVGLLGDLLLIPLLERVRGLTYLRFSAALMLVLFALFLLVPNFWVKLVLLAFMGLFNSGWYAILQGQLYTAMPGQSGTAMAVGSIFGLFGSAVPALLGLIAQTAGLGFAMWLLMLGPIALLIGLPRQLAPVTTASDD
jgi:FSR family fosmidomycin resistance protein-like MFS transporter